MLGLTQWFFDSTGICCMSLSQVKHSGSSPKSVLCRFYADRRKVLHGCFRRSCCTQLLWQTMTRASTEVSASGAGMEHMSTPGITTLKMRHAVSGLEENDLALKDMKQFQCRLREVSACCRVVYWCHTQDIFCSVVSLVFVLIQVQAYKQVRSPRAPSARCHAQSAAHAFMSMLKHVQPVPGQHEAIDKLAICFRLGFHHVQPHLMYNINQCAAATSTDRIDRVTACSNTAGLHECSICCISVSCNSVHSHHTYFHISELGLKVSP